MKKLILFASLCVSAVFAAAPVKVIFDTDIGTDFDDEGATAVLHALADRGEAEILATVSCNRAKYTVAALEIINRYYGRPEIPVGCVGPAGVNEGDKVKWYAPTYEKLVAKYPGAPHPVSTDAPDAVAVYRKVLAAAPDKSVAIATVGFLTNLKLLLESKPDAVSPLNGRDLVAKKVFRLSSMACRFPEGREYNAFCDTPSSQYVFSNWPTPIVFSGFEIGVNIHTGRRLVALPDTNNPVRDIFAMLLRPEEKDGHCSWDETAVLVAVRGPGDLFGTEQGTVHMEADGKNTWTADPKGPHTRLLKKMEWTDVASIVEDLMMRPPLKKNAATAYRRLSVEEYRDKMKGGWIGQIAGVVWGAPTEFKFQDKIIPENAMPKWTPDMINNAFGQDDLYVEMTFLRSLEQYGLNVDIRQAGIDFANSRYGLWCANAAGRSNLRAGIAPPDSSHPKFSSRANDIDYQIEADFAGLISPGMPQSVISLGNKFGRLMNYGDGLYGGQFMGGMYAEAFFTQDIQKIVEAGLACIPPGCQYAEMVRDLLRWHAENPADWQGCWNKIIEKYRKNPAYQKCSNGGIDVKINGAILLMGLLFGNHDLDNTIVIATRGGFDSDCNPSSAAGPLFTSLGFKALPPRFSEKLQLEPKFSFTSYNVPELINVCEKLARQIVVQEGGRMEKDASGAEFFVIPVRQPQPNMLELTWAPGPIANSLYTPEEYAKISPHTYREQHFADPDPTRRVQKTLDVLFPGWKTSPNAPDMNPGFRPEMDGTANVLVTHPPKKGEPVILSRTMAIPAENPRLVLRVANDQGGDFRLVVRVNGALALATDVTGKEGFRTYEIGLAPYAGKTVTLEVLNQPTDWMCEAAYWAKLDVLSGK